MTTRSSQSANKLAKIHHKREINKACESLRDGMLNQARRSTWPQILWQQHKLLKSNKLWAPWHVDIMGKLEACTCRFSFSSCFLGSRMLKVCWLELWNTPVLQVLPIQASGNPHACPKGEAGMPQNHIKTSAIESAGWMAASGLSTSHLRQRQRWLFKSFQIQNGLRHVETLGKRTAVKLKDLEAGCIWEGVTSKANNHQKKHQNTKNDNLNWASRWYLNSLSHSLWFWDWIHIKLVQTFSRPILINSSPLLEIIHLVT